MVLSGTAIVGLVVGSTFAVSNVLSATHESVARTQLVADSSGNIVVSRSDGVTAVLSRPGSPDSRVALPRRDLAELLSEDLRRLDPDTVYGDVLAHLGQR